MVVDVWTVEVDLIDEWRTQLLHVLVPRTDHRADQWLTQARSPFGEQLKCSDDLLVRLLIERE